MENRFQHIIVGLFCCLSLMSCDSMSHVEQATSTPPNSVWRPPVHFTEADLIGKWELWNNSDASGELVLKSDYTFMQTFDVYNSSTGFKISGTWRVENRSSGCTYIYLRGMRLFQMTATANEQVNRDADGTPIPFVDRCENAFLRMPDQVILIVGSAANQPRGTVLLFPRSNADGNDEVMSLASTTPVR